MSKLGAIPQGFLSNLHFVHTMFTSAKKSSVRVGQSSFLGKHYHITNKTRITRNAILNSENVRI